jgi:hypothetical protein
LFLHVKTFKAVIFKGLSTGLFMDKLKPASGEGFGVAKLHHSAAQ